MNDLTAQTAFYKQLFNDYTAYCQSGYDHKYIEPEKLKQELLQYSSNHIIHLQVLGKSFEGRDIFCLRAGKGKIKILLWSQMHGDESTATRALLDVFRFLTNDNDKYSAERKAMLENLSLCFVPMLNPDGAMRWQRRTAQDIDMNRDALRNVTTEGRLLQHLFKEFTPDYAFNLHDQASYYTAGQTPHAATISLLAPPVDDMNTIPANRRRSMQLVCAFNRILQQYIPNHVGKWTDNYEPRAFGEHFQRQGAATILIESGGRKGDPERNLARKLNFVMLISGLQMIANGDILKEDISTYAQIPVNQKENIFDIIYKDVKVHINGKDTICDVGVRCTEKVNVEKKLVPFFTIEDIGDLSPFGAFEVIDGKGKQLVSKDNVPILIGKPANLILSK